MSSSGKLLDEIVTTGRHKESGICAQTSELNKIIRVLSDKNLDLLLCFARGLLKNGYQ